MSRPIFTIGHSNRTLLEFVELLDEHAVRQVVDVRRLPGSARYPQFDEDALARSLGERGIALDRAEGLTGRSRPTAVMCSEAVWWRCHRRIIADHLLARGDEVIHILAPHRTETARLSEGAVVGEGFRVTYPAIG